MQKTNGISKGIGFGDAFLCCKGCPKQNTNKDFQAVAKKRATMQKSASQLAGSPIRALPHNKWKAKKELAACDLQTTSPSKLVHCIYIRLLKFGRYLLFFRRKYLDYTGIYFPPERVMVYALSRKYCAMPMLSPSVPDSA